MSQGVSGEPVWASCAVGVTGWWGGSQSAVPSGPVVTCPCSPWVPVSATATVTPGTRAPESWAVTVTVTDTFVPAGAWATSGVTASYEVPGDPGTPEGGELLEMLYAELNPDG